MGHDLQNMRQVVVTLIPSSLLSDITCFVFYDNHPRSKKNIDITICTENGELKEFYNRDSISSLNLNCVFKPTYVRIARNSDSKLFYLVNSQDELYIISSEEKLQIYKKLSNIEKYEINDAGCSGQTYLKVICKDDAVPLLFDSNFNSLEDQDIASNTQNVDDLLPILTDLKRKLVEARYIAKCNENTYSQYVNLRQRASLMCCQNLYPNSSTAFKDDSKNITGALKLKTKKPWVKVCNKKMIIMLNVLNECKESLENTHMLISNATEPSLVYTTKLYLKIPTSPFWQETNTHKLNPNQEYAVVAVMNLEEVKQNITSRIELSGSMSYRMLEKEYLLPFDEVAISSLESMKDEFDVLSSNKRNDYNTILAILAASEKMELCLRHIKNQDKHDVSVLELFCTHLQMETLLNAENVIVYRKSPYHVLNGTMIVFHEHNAADDAVLVTLHTRSQAQVLALLRYIYDGVNAKIVATTPAYKITAKTDEFSHCNEETATTSKNLNYMGYATSILNRSSRILEHLDNSMIKMSESKNPSVLSKVGSHIDLFAGGVNNFKEFRDGLLEETIKGIDSLNKSDSIGFNSDSDVMIID